MHRPTSHAYGFGLLASAEGGESPLITGGLDSEVEIVETSSPPVVREWAKDEDSRCYYEDCWLVHGHPGLHAYHPMFSGSTDLT